MDSMLADWLVLCAELSRAVSTANIDDRRRRHRGDIYRKLATRSRLAAEFRVEMDNLEKRG